MTKINNLNVVDSLESTDKLVVWRGSTQAITAQRLAEYVATIVPDLETAATYADLTAISATNRATGDLVYVAARTTPGDGGEGWWRFDALASDVANGGTILAPDAGTGRWLRLFTGAANVAWFGAVADGVSDARAAFQAAASVANEIFAGVGNYFLSSDLALPGKRIRLAPGASFAGSNYITGAIVIRYDPSTAAEKVSGGDDGVFFGGPRFGQINGLIGSGVGVGGGDVEDGANFQSFHSDSYHGWTVFQPSVFGSAIEHAIQPNSISGRATKTNGGNTLTRVSGALFVDEMVNLPIGVGADIYRVSSVNEGSQTLTVTTLAGGAVTFSNGDNVSFVVACVIGSGTCSVAGTTITRIEGDPFVPITNTDYLIELGAVGSAPISVSSVANGSVLTLGSAPGDQLNVAYRFITSVDFLVAALRLHAFAGSGYEHNLTIASRLNGEFFIHNDNGGYDNEEATFWIGNGNNADFAKRKIIILQSDGNLLLGGEASSGSLVVTHVDPSVTAVTNKVAVAGAAAGSPPRIETIGVDTNVDFLFATKGAGKFLFESSSGTVSEIIADKADQRAILGAYFEAGVGQFAYLRATDNAQTAALSLKIQSGTNDRIEVNSTGLSFFGVPPVAKQSHIPDPSGGVVVDIEARTAINAILALLENFGFKNTS